MVRVILNLGTSHRLEVATGDGEHRWHMYVLLTTALHGTVYMVLLFGCDDACSNNKLCFQIVFMRIITFRILARVMMLLFMSFGIDLFSVFAGSSQCPDRHIGETC
jgi:uncharacterized membrane protein YozB (DUF420 family)